PWRVCAKNWPRSRAMNEHDEALEAELAALTPQGPSAALQDRIASELAAGSAELPGPRPSRIWWSGAGTGALLAACAAAALIWLPPAPDMPREIEPPFSPTQIPIVNAFNESLPTFWTYQQALTHSPEDVETLLDKHVLLASPNASREPRHVFIRSDAQPL